MVEFDLETAHLDDSPAADEEAAAALIPLSLQTVAMLAGIRGVNHNIQYVFPHRDDRKKPITTASQRSALKALGWATKYSPHATRATGSTQLNKMGYPSCWIERQLAHTEPTAVRGAYNRAQHLEDRRGMMQAWRDILNLLEANGKIIPGNFRKTA